MKKKRNFLLKSILLQLNFSLEKAGILLVLVLVFSIQAKAYSQTRITAKRQGVTIDEVLKEVREKSGYRFLYRVEEVNRYGKRDIDVKDAEVEDFLGQLLQNTDLTYEVENEVIIIRPEKQRQDSRVNVQVVRGKVTDENNLALPGATVLLKGTSYGVVTDSHGKFTMEVLERDTVTLLVSFVGMETRLVNLKKGQTEILVSLEPDIKEMKEVVVTGYGNVRKTSFTGNSVTVTKDELMSVSKSNVIKALQTFDPSFRIQTNNDWGSDPNALPEMYVRGRSGISGVKELDRDPLTKSALKDNPNLPTFIMDGFQISVEQLYDMDPNRIESITILKDAAATALYGSRAANGVVVITTVAPQMGKLNVSYNFTGDVTVPDLSDYNLMNAREKLETEVAAGVFEDLAKDNPLGAEQQYYAKLASITRGVDTYWLSEPLQMGFNHRHNLYAEGGDEHMRYGFGLSYNGVTGVMKDSKKNLFSGNLDLLYRKGKLQFSNKLTVNLSNSGDPVVNFSTYAAANPYYEKRVDGQVEKWLEYVEDYIEAPNPLWNASLNSRSLKRSLGITDNFAVEYNPFQSLKLRGRIGITRTTSETDDFISPEDTRFEDTEELKKGSLTYSNTKSFNYDGEFSAIYGTIFAERHRLNVVGGASFSNSQSERNGYSVIGFPKGAYDTPAFANSYPENGKASYGDSQSRSMSVYFNGGYAYNSKYLMDVTWRMNGSSVFGSNHRYMNTWSFGLAWNLHNESFIADLFQMLKIRASIGNPGNQSFASYQSITTYNFNNRQRNYFEQAINLYALGNPDLKWQVTLDRNIGVDVTLLQNRVSFTLDYYDKNTDPVLASISVPASVGVTTVLTNIGEQRSNGFNGSVTVSPIYRPSERIIWSLRYNFRTQKSKYDNIGNSLDKFNEEGQNTNLKRYYDGASPDDLWAVRSAGIDPATGQEIFIKKDGSYTYDFSFSDEVKVGTDRPKIEGVFGSSFTYKGFSVNFDFRYRCGGQMFNSSLFNKVENITSAGLNNNQDKRAFYDRWKNPGDRAKYKAINLTGSTQMSSRFVEDDNTLTLESFRVGYEFDSAAIAKFGLKALRVNAYMNDVFKISSIKTERGTEYPFARSFSLSVSASF